MADPKTVHFAKEGEPSMKAAIYEQYTSKASDMKIASNIALPQDLKPDHVLVKVKSSSINPVDYKLRQGDFKLAIPSHFPKITGRDLSGIIDKVGSKVTKFKVGDEVYGMAESIIGTNCEYVNCSERSLAKKPASLNWHEAAGVPLAALTAWEGLKDYGNLEAGKSCLIFGGSSGVGHFAVQMAKIIGATVWTTCGTSNVDYVKSLGADHVIDYKTQDFTKVLGEKVDLVFDVVGNKHDRDRSFEFLKPNGVVVTTTPNNPENEFGFTEVMRVAGDMIWKNITHIGSGIKYKTFLVKEFSGDQLESLNGYFDSGKIKIRIDSVMTLYQIIEAHEKIESGKAQGKIIIEISQ